MKSLCYVMGFPGSSAVKQSACNAGDPSSIPGPRGPLEKARLPTPVFSGFASGSASKESACNAGDLGSIPGLGSPPEEGGNPLQHSCLEEPGGLQSMVLPRVGRG